MPPGIVDIAPGALVAANDNAPAIADLADRMVLREALRQCAVHGDDAAEHVRGEAERAFFAGRRRDYLRWMAICRALDRRMVDVLTVR